MPEAIRIAVDLRNRLDVPLQRDSLGAKPLRDEGQRGVDHRGHVHRDAHRGSRASHVEQRPHDLRNPFDLLRDRAGAPLRVALGGLGLEEPGVALDDTHGRADLVGESRRQQTQGGELLGLPRPLCGPPQLRPLLRQVPGEGPAGAGQLVVQVLELPLAAIDVGVHGQLRVEVQELGQRRAGLLGSLASVSEGVADDPHELSHVELWYEHLFEA